MARRKFRSIDEYISACPVGVRTTLEEIRRNIRLAAPGATEAISYQIPTFKLNGDLVYFAAFKSHIGFYPTSSGIKAFREELSPYECSIGAVRFPLDRPIPFELVRRIVAFRVEENSAKEHRSKRPSQ